VAWLALAVGGKLEVATIDKLLSMQRLDGSWGTVLVSVLGLQLLLERGCHPDSNRLRLTLDKVYAEQCADGSFGNLEETALVLGALRQAGLSPTHPTVARACAWLEGHFDEPLHCGSPEAQLAYGEYLQWKCEKG